MSEYEYNQGDKEVLMKVRSLIRDEICLVAGGWEPLMYLRRDSSGNNLEEMFLKQHSDESFRKMADDGINLFITHYHKGFGWEVIQEELKDVQRQIETLHKLNMLAGTYFRIDNVLGETFFLEMPEAREWLVKPRDGSNNATILNRYFRHRVCRNVPAYRDYVKKVINYALKEIHADVMHLDGFHGALEKEECVCEFCNARFKSFLKKRWSGCHHEAESRFGFPDISGIEIPGLGGGNRNEASASIITDPVYQEYIRFRCEDWAEWHAYISGIMAEVKPDAVLSTNCGVFSWQNTAAQMGIYFPFLKTRNTLIFIEDGHYPGVRENGVIAHRVRDLKISSSLGLRCVAFSHQYSVPYFRRVVSESMVFNSGIMGHVNTDGDVNARVAPGPMECAELTALVKWRQDNNDLFDNTESASRIAVLRNFESMTYDCFAPMRHTMLVEETLLRNHLHFDIVFNEQIDSLRQRGISTLVIASQTCISDGIAAKIAKFRHDGGSLLVTGQSGARNEFAVVRKDNILVKALALDEAISLLARTTKTSYDEKETVAMAKFENVFSDNGSTKGMSNQWPSEAFHADGVAYIPEVISSVSKENWYPKWQFDITKGWACYGINGECSPESRLAKEYAFTNWRLPINAGQIVDNVNYLLKPVIRINAPDTVFINHLRQPEKSRELIFFLNYSNESSVLAASVFIEEDIFSSAEFRSLEIVHGIKLYDDKLYGIHHQLPEFQTLGVLVLTYK